MENPQSSLISKGLAGVVRYWSVVVGITYELGDGWPGYRYTAAEREQLDKLSKDLTGKQLWAFFGLNTLLCLIFAALLVLGGVWPGVYLLAPNLADLRFWPFAVLLGSLCVIMVSVAMPTAMGITSLVLNRFWPWTVPLDPGPEQIRQLARKMLRQFFVMGLLGTALSIAVAAIFQFTGDGATGGNGGLLVAVLRVVAPSITFGTTLYLLARRGS